MSSNDYNVKVKTFYPYGRTDESVIKKSRLMQMLRDAYNKRCDLWVESAHPYIPEYKNPFTIIKLKFNKLTGELESLELKKD